MSRHIVARRITIFRSRFYNHVALVVQMVHDLHATKGWRLIQTRKGKTDDPRVPVWHQQFVRTRPQKKTYVEPPPITEKALMRHGWYRRKMKKESQLVAAGHVTDAEVF